MGVDQLYMIQELNELDHKAKIAECALLQAENRALREGLKIAITVAEGWYDDSCGQVMNDDRWNGIRVVAGLAPRAGRQLVRIVGDDPGIYTLPEIAARLSVQPDTAGRLVDRQRKRGSVTWAGLRGLASAASSDRSPADTAAPAPADTAAPAQANGDGNGSAGPA